MQVYNNIVNIKKAEKNLKSGAETGTIINFYWSINYTEQNVQHMNIFFVSFKFILFANHFSASRFALLIILYKCSPEEEIKKKKTYKNKRETKENKFIDIKILII